MAIVHPGDPAIDMAGQGIIDAFRKQFARAQAVRAGAPVISARFYAD